MGTSMAQIRMRATLLQEFPPYRARLPVTEVRPSRVLTFKLPLSNQPIASGRLTACHPFPKAPGRTADVHQVSRKMARAVSWPNRENRRVMGTMDKIRVLIVDDSWVMRKIVERSLRQAGIELEKVVEASNGAEALAALHENVVDLILCDINMPVMDGLEFVRQVATVESAKGVPIVMITTEGSESHVVQALSAGARGYIRKPFTPDQVKEHVLPLLGKKP